MVQGLRSMRAVNRVRRWLCGERRASVGGGEKRVGAPLWAQAIAGISCGCLVLVALYLLLHPEVQSSDFLTARRLRSNLCSVDGDDGDDGDCPSGASHPALIIVYLLGVFYLFIGIAIVCDEFFVPALEQIGIFWDLSDDVCGATLMAAGGSAPELATSLIGTFTGSDVGFGTIVGSAVFNVLFVIACCVLSTPKQLAPLELTGWPLARDCLFYSLTLVCVAICFGISSPGIIEGWEACWLLCMYFLYVILMRFNDALYCYFNSSVSVTDTKIIEKPPGDGEKVVDSKGNKIHPEDDSNETADLEAPKDSPQAQVVHASHHNRRRRSSVNGVTGVAHKNQSVNICPSNARAGFFHLVCQKDITDTAGSAIVNKIKGDVRESFDALDKDKSGTIDVQELKELLKMLSHSDKGEVTDEDAKAAMSSLDLDGSGYLDFAEFTIWYVNSKERLKNEVRIAWSKFDKDHMGMPLSSLEDFLEELSLTFTEERFEGILKELMDNKYGGKSENHPPTADVTITFEEFNEWYLKSEFFEAKSHEAKHASETAGGIWSDISDFPKDTLRGNVLYVLMFPLTITLACTCGVKDVRIPGNEKWAFYQFFTAIAWIGAYSYVLVDWVTTIGLTLKIPVYVLGLTLLAGGTSVPDLLSSVVVAQAGKGDMAVSSSIGSNIFDVAVGLPLPWLLFNLVMDCPVSVGAENLEISIAVLLVMVLFVIISIMASKWAMNFKLGGTMMLLYVVFLAQDITRIYVKGNVGC